MALLLWQLVSILLGSEVFITIIIMVVIWRHCKWSKRPSSSSTDKKALHTTADDIILEDLFSSDANVEIGVPPSNHSSLRRAAVLNKLSNDHPSPSLSIRGIPIGRSPRVSPEHPKEFLPRVASPLVSKDNQKANHGVTFMTAPGRASPVIEKEYPVEHALSDSPGSSVRESSIGISFRESTSSISPAPYFRPKTIGESNTPTHLEIRNGNISSLRESVRIESPIGHLHNSSPKRPLSTSQRPTMGSEAISPYNIDIFEGPFPDNDDRGPGRVRFEPLWKGKSPDLLPNKDINGSFKYFEETNHD